MNRIVVALLRVLVVIFGLVTVAAMAWLMPFISRELVILAPEFGDLKIPLLILSEVDLACFFAFLVCLFVLLSGVQSGKVFDPSSLRWVSVMIVLCFCATGITLAAAVSIPGPPLLGLLIILTALLCFSLALLLIVMKHLLIQAMSWRGELEEVI